MSSPKVVLANGCFDVLHYGHFLHLRAALAMGDILHVAITRDEFVGKGSDRPYYDQDKRSFMVLALKGVSSTLLVDDPIEAFKYYEPDIWALGKEYEHKVRLEHAEYCKSNGIEIRFTAEECDSSTNVINELRRR